MFLPENETEELDAFTVFLATDRVGTPATTAETALQAAISANL
jgi:hypothetical protein